MEICVQMQYNSLIFTQDGFIMLKITLQKRNAIISHAAQGIDLLKNIKYINKIHFLPLRERVKKSEDQTIHSDPKKMLNTALLPRLTRQTADSSTQNEANLNKCCNLVYLFIRVISTMQATIRNQKYLPTKDLQFCFLEVYLFLLKCHIC